MARWLSSKAEISGSKQAGGVDSPLAIVSRASCVQPINLARERERESRYCTRNRARFVPCAVYHAKKRQIGG